jgi:hypothetical protein
MRVVRTIANALQARLLIITASQTRNARPLPLAGEGRGGGSFGYKPELPRSATARSILIVALIEFLSRGLDLRLMLARPFAQRLHRLP